VRERIEAMSQEDLRRFLEVAPRHMRLGDWIGEWWPLPRWLEHEARHMIQNAVDQQEHVGCEVLALSRRRSDLSPPLPRPTLTIRLNRDRFHPLFAFLNPVDSKRDWIRFRIEFRLHCLVDSLLSLLHPTKDARLRQLRERRELMRGRVFVAGADSAEEDPSDDDVGETTDVDDADHLEEAVPDDGAGSSGGDARHTGGAAPSCPVVPPPDHDEPVVGDAGAGAAGGDAGRAADAGPSLDVDETADGDVADPPADPASSGPEVFFIGEDDEGRDDAEDDDYWNTVWPEASIAFCTDGFPIPLHSFGSMWQSVPR